MRERESKEVRETEKQRDIYIWRKEERERQRDRETERQRDRETERQRDRETERQRDRKGCQSMINNTFTVVIALVLF
jgi:hypothetical protein